MFFVSDLDSVVVLQCLSCVCLCLPCLGFVKVLNRIYGCQKQSKHSGLRGTADIGDNSLRVCRCKQTLSHKPNDCDPLLK